MAPSRKSPGVVIKRGRKGRTVLHLGVIASELEEPGEVSKPRITGLVEATENYVWYLALENLDCKRLMEELQENPCLLVQKGPEGCTVVHAAAIRGCLRLLDQIYDVFGDGHRFVDDDKGISFPLQELLYAKYGKSGLRAVDLLEFVVTEKPETLKILGYLRSAGDRGSDTFLSIQDIVFNSFVPKRKPEPRGGDASDLVRQRREEKNLGSDTTVPEQDETSDSVNQEDVEGRSSSRILLQRVLTKHHSLHMEHLNERFQNDLDYNFVVDYEEMRFHHACANMYLPKAEAYVKAVIEECAKLGSQSAEVLRYLFQLRDPQGRPPLHTALFPKILLELIPEGEEYEACVNARDGRGWTPLHRAAAEDSKTRVSYFLEDGRTDVNATVDDDSRHDASALHLAIMHDNSQVVEELLKDPRTDVNALFKRPIFVGAGLYQHRWTPLQLAAVMGHSSCVKFLITCSKISEHERETSRKYGPKFSAVHAAAALGDPETLRSIVRNPSFDPLITCKRGKTALHYAVDATAPEYQGSVIQIYPLTLFGDYVSIHQIEQRCICMETRKKLLTGKEREGSLYKGNEACISILVQAGVDVWQKDDDNNYPKPGPKASYEAHLLWQQKVANETLEAKRDLNDAGNAISVVAALVATASYVGPLQPPLGYGSNSIESFVQTTNMSVRVFMVSNSLSFYLAIASIMFAVVPSLPMPQEGIYEEWQRTRQTIVIAISLLLMSVLGVLVSFAAAANAVLLEEYSFRHAGLTFYPAIVGGLLCLVGIIWFFLRLLRLTFNKNVIIRRLYQKLFRVRQN